MATGTPTDILIRLKAVLPGGWFPLTSAGQPSATPILDALLSGPAWALSWAYSLIQYVQLQQRIATATDVFLDLCARDYFGGGLTRNNGETDAAFSIRIRASLLRPAATRAAITTALTNLTGRAPNIFEPWDTGDAGGYGGGYAPVWRSLAYNTAGGYGSLQLPGQAFITAYRPLQGGIANVGGYNGQVPIPAPMNFVTSTGSVVSTSTEGALQFLVGQVYAPGGYGVGAMEYVNPSMSGSQVTDAEIFATVAATQAAGVTCWTQISS
jgi:hypothetical protein